MLLHQSKLAVILSTQSQLQFEFVLGLLLITRGFNYFSTGQRVKGSRKPHRTILPPLQQESITGRHTNFNFSPKYFITGICLNFCSLLVFRRRAFFAEFRGQSFSIFDAVGQRLKKGSIHQEPPWRHSLKMRYSENDVTKDLVHYYNHQKPGKRLLQIVLAVTLLPPSHIDSI